MSVDWRQVPGRFEAFLAWLQPTSEERRNAAAAVQTVAALVRQSLRQGRRLDAALVNPLVVGGFGKGTAIRDGGPADVLMVLPSRSHHLDTDGKEAARRGSANADADTVDSAAASFAAALGHGDGGGTAASGILPRMRVVPAYTRERGGYLVPDRQRLLGGGPWRLMQPAAELRHLNAADAVSGGKARHLIQMAKAWRRTTAAPIAPFALELLVCQFLGVWIYRRRSVYFYDWLVRDFFFWLTAQTDSELSIPGSGETLNSGHGWRRHAERAYRLAALAADLERDNRGSESLLCWSLVFGGEFLLARQMYPAGVPAIIRRGGP